MLNQITTMRLPDGSEVAFVDWQDKPLFSTVDFLSGFTDADINAFTYVAGDTIPATANGTAPRLASERDTNVATPGSMASTEEMLVYAIKPHYQEFRTADATPTALNSFQNAQGGQPTPSTSRLSLLQTFLTLNLIVSQKIEQGAPLAYFNTGFGPYSGTAQDVAATATIPRGTAGFPTQEAVRSLVIPIHIGGQEAYRVQFANYAGLLVSFGVNEASPPVIDNQIIMQVMVHLDGLYKRPVS